MRGSEKMSFFKCVVKYWDEINNITKEGKCLVYGSSFKEVVEKLDKWYQLIDILHCYPLEEGDVFDFELEADDYPFKVITTE